MWMYRGLDTDSRPPSKMTWALIRRVLAYARPYRLALLGGLILILLQIAISLISPLLFRDLIDHALPERDLARINLLALGLVLIPIVDNVFSIIGRFLNAKVGEGVIFDLRRTLYAHLQRMSLRFFTRTKGGELISRLNNDVVNAQTAITDTLIGAFSQTIRLIAILAVMIALDWRLTLIGAAVFPFFYLLSNLVGARLRIITRESMELNAQMNAMMNETLNIGGALLVKLFGQRAAEVARFESRAARVRDIGVRRAVFASQFWALLGLVSVVGTGVVY